jgi:hypothetical protein
VLGRLVGGVFSTKCAAEIFAGVSWSFGAHFRSNRRMTQKARARPIKA